MLIPLLFYFVFVYTATKDTNPHERTQYESNLLRFVRHFRNTVVLQICINTSHIRRIMKRGSIWKDSLEVWRRMQNGTWMLVHHSLISIFFYVLLYYILFRSTFPSCFVSVSLYAYVFICIFFCISCLFEFLYPAVELWSGIWCVQMQIYVDNGTKKMIHKAKKYMIISNERKIETHSYDMRIVNDKRKRNACNALVCVHSVACNGGEVFVWLGVVFLLCVRGGLWAYDWNVSVRLPLTAHVCECE